MFHDKKINFYGSGTIGEKGQVVIPAKAREQLDIKSGEEFIFFGVGQVIHVIKANQIDSVLNKMSEHFSEKISGIREQIQASKK